VIQKKLKEVTIVGLVGFFAPFLGCSAIAYYLLGWNPQASLLCGVALSTTSMAVVYAVMLETGFNKTDFGKGILGACFVNDLGTVIALGILFAPFTYKTGVFIAATVVVAYQYPIHIRLHVKVQVSTLAYFLIAALLPLPLALGAAGFGTLLGEVSVRQQRKLYPSDIATAVGRWVLIILLGSLVAHAPTSGGDELVLLTAAALVLWVGDFTNDELGGAKPMDVPRQTPPSRRKYYLYGGVGVAVLLATHLGLPVSTTHAIAGAIAGVGSIQRLKAVRWGIATNIVWAWVLTIPMSALIAWLAFRLLHLTIGA